MGRGGRWTRSRWQVAQRARVGERGRDDIGAGRNGWLARNGSVFPEWATFRHQFYFSIWATWRSKYNCLFLLKPNKPILAVISSNIALLAGGDDRFND